MRRRFALLCLPLSALALAACGSTVSTAGFTGERHEAAQTIANLQSAATAAEEKKICADDLAAALVTRLGGAKGCEAAIKSQLAEVDNLEASVESVDVAAGGRTATARVKSIHEGKNATSAVSLVKEGGKWKISGAGSGAG
jgi:hypothetical protein